MLFRSISQQLAVSLTLLGWQLKNSTDNQEKQKPSQPIRLHAASLGQFSWLPSAEWMVLVTHVHVPLSQVRDIFPALGQRGPEGGG